MYIVQYCMINLLLFLRIFLFLRSLGIPVFCGNFLQLQLISFIISYIIISQNRFLPIYILMRVVFSVFTVAHNYSRHNSLYLYGKYKLVYIFQMSFISRICIKSEQVYNDYEFELFELEPNVIIIWDNFTYSSMVPMFFFWCDTIF